MDSQKMKYLKVLKNILKIKTRDLIKFQQEHITDL